MLELAFEGQMHYGSFYAYVKLKEQEIRNLVWISECILQQQKEEINKFVPFSFHAPWRAGSKSRH
jgi:V-type H+-transporting ATPase subunit d